MASFDVAAVHQAYSADVAAIIGAAHAEATATVSSFGRRQSADQQQGQTPVGILEQYLESKSDFSDDAKSGERHESSEVDRCRRFAARVESAKQHREADAEQERERTPRLLLGENPNAPTNQVLHPSRFATHVLVEVNENHAEERQAPKNVQRVNTLIGRDRCGCGRLGDTVGVDRQLLGHTRALCWDSAVWSQLGRVDGGSPTY